ncbi:hypothetical protein [Lactobacillus crispatus]|nr:hypothetical protein [Lactobacillus crispatus]
MASITKKRIQVQIDDGVVEEGNAVLKKIRFNTHYCYHNVL